MSSSAEGGPAGISVSPFLKGQQEEDVLSALAGQTAAAEQSARSMQGAAGRVGADIRRAAAASNVLEQAQLARQAGRAAQGMAAGGGAAQASGSIAAQGMRERMAAQAATAAQATQAELGAMQAYNQLRERAAQARSEEVAQRGEIAQANQQALAAFNMEVDGFVNQFETGQVNKEQAAQNISNLVSALDLGDPIQRTAAKNSFRQLWMMATERPKQMPSDGVLDVLIDAGMPLSQLFASWAGENDKKSASGFWSMVRDFYNANKPEGAAASESVQFGSTEMMSIPDIEAAILSLGATPAPTPE